jgi:hypothetical protein
MLTLVFSLVKRLEKTLSMAEIRFVTPRFEGMPNAFEAEVIFFSMPDEASPY